VIHFARECLQRPFAEFRTRPNRAIKGVLLQNRRPEKPLHAGEELRTEDPESLGGDCSGCMRRHSWPVIAQADVRSGGRGARKWLRLRYCASERNNTPLRARRGWARHHFATRFFRRLVRISPHHAELAKQFTVVAVGLRGIGGSAATAGGYDAANIAEDVHQLAEHLHLEHVYVVGHGIGAMVAYAFVRRYPETSRGVMSLKHRSQALGRGMRLKPIPSLGISISSRRRAFLSSSLPVAKPFICAIFSIPILSAMRMSRATPGHMPLLNICVRRWRSIGPFRRMRNSIRHNKAPSACRWYSLRAKTRHSRSSCQASPMRCGRMGAQTLRSKSSRTAYISSRMSGPMLWLNSSNGMPRYNDDYRMLWQTHEELTRVAGRERKREPINCARRSWIWS
jgi:pimeloyl-ACP methyl ester carboxylesterase